jgi:hypothetical protein
MKFLKMVLEGVAKLFLILFVIIPPFCVKLSDLSLPTSGTVFTLFLDQFAHFFSWSKFDS